MTRGCETRGCDEGVTRVQQGVTSGNNKGVTSGNNKGVTSGAQKEHRVVTLVDNHINSEINILFNK